jgi:hypothetical protein
MREIHGMNRSFLCTALLVSAACSGSARHGDQPPEGGVAGPAAPVAVQAPATTLLYSAEGPDDGPGYRIAIGTGPAAPDACDGRRHPGQGARPFAQGDYTTITLAAFTWSNARLRLPSPLAEAMWCSADHRCEVATSGTLQLDTAIEGRRAAGRFALAFPHGKVTGTLQASWCGPAREPGKPLAARALDGLDLAAQADGVVTWKGVLTLRHGQYTLASELCETSPPKPCGTTIPLDVADPEIADGALTETAANGTNLTRWSKGAAIVNGQLVRGRLQVAAITLAP